LRYPGNLADDLRAFSRPTLRIWGTGAAIAAIAAAAAVLVLVIRYSNYIAPTPELTIVQEAQTTTTATEDVTLAEAPALAIPELPDGMDLTPPAMDMSFSPPSFSLLDEPISNSASTTQEAT